MMLQMFMFWSVHIRLQQMHLETAFSLPFILIRCCFVFFSVVRPQVFFCSAVACNAELPLCGSDIAMGQMKHTLLELVLKNVEQQ